MLNFHSITFYSVTINYAILFPLINLLIYSFVVLHLFLLLYMHHQSWNEFHITVSIIFHPSTLPSPFLHPVLAPADAGGLVVPPPPETFWQQLCIALTYSLLTGTFWTLLQQGVRFDPDMPQTIRLEFAKSNTKVSKPKQQSPPTAAQHPTLVHPFTGRKYSPRTTHLFDHSLLFFCIYSSDKHCVLYIYTIYFKSLG